MELIKYKNKKLYCPILKKYVTLEYVVDAVKNGENISIRMHETNADVTLNTLKQCVVKSTIDKNTLLNVLKEF